MAAPTVLAAAAPKIGFTGSAITGIWRVSQSFASAAEEEVVKDEDNATCAVVISDKADEVTVSATMKATGYTRPAVGDTVQINSVNYRITGSPTVAEGKTLCTVNFTARKEASMTYS